VPEIKCRVKSKTKDKHSDSFDVIILHNGFPASYTKTTIQEDTKAVSIPLNMLQIIFIDNFVRVESTKKD